MPLERWAGFALVWLALSLLTFDALRTARRAARALKAGGAVAGVRSAAAVDAKS
jgi:chloramphenicol-sensitive protein RarD